MRVQATNKILLGTLIVLGLLVLITLPFRSSAAELTESPNGTKIKAWLKHHADTLKTLGSTKKPKERLAYVTFLAFSEHNGQHNDDDEANKHRAEEYIDEHEDRYFIACRLLGWQLMHQEKTKTRRNIPFIVLTTDDISDFKRGRLERDGAIVISVSDVPSLTWYDITQTQWSEVFTKLRAWELTDRFDRALFLDVDHILTRPLDGVFDDPAAQTTLTLNGTIASMHDDEAKVPDTYVFASLPEAVPEHSFPPKASENHFKDVHYFNAGFFVFAPSIELFKYYLSVMSIKERFEAQYPEQGLLNYAHRREGSVPWKSIDVTWNIHFPKMDDKKAGAASLHDKWWHPETDGNLADWYISLRWKMEGYYEALEALRPSPRQQVHS